MAMTVTSHDARWLSHMASVSETGSHKALRYLGVITVWHCKHAKCTFTQKAGIPAITKPLQNLPFNSYWHCLYELNSMQEIHIVSHEVNATGQCRSKRILLARHTHRSCPLTHRATLK